MKIVRESIIDEVLRSENDWADRELDRWEGKDVPEPEEKEFNWDDHAPGDSDIPDGDFERRNPYQERHNDEKGQYLSHIRYLEEYIWENARPDQLQKWMGFIDSFKKEFNELELEDLEEIFIRATMLVNELKHKSSE